MRKVMEDKMKQITLSKYDEIAKEFVLVDNITGNELIISNKDKKWEIF